MSHKRHPEPDILAFLNRYNACYEAISWVRDSRLSTRDMWRTCEHADWMLWIAAKLGVDRKLIVLAACDCAETALQFVLENEDRPRKAIESARAWCRGEATTEEVRASTTAAYAAAYDADAITAASIVRKQIPWRVIRSQIARVS